MHTIYMHSQFSTSTLLFDLWNEKKERKNILFLFLVAIILSVAAAADDDSFSADFSVTNPQMGDTNIKKNVIKVWEHINV